MRGTHSRTSKIIAQPVRLLNCGAEVAGPWLLFWLQNVDNLTTSAAHKTFAQRRWNFHGTRLQMLQGILTKKRLIRNPHHDGKFKVRIRGVVENRQAGGFYDGKGGVWSTPNADVAEAYAYPESAGVVLKHTVPNAPSSVYKDHSTMQVMMICELRPPWKRHGTRKRSFCTFQTSSSECLIAARGVLVRPWNRKRGHPLHTHYPAKGTIKQLELARRRPTKTRTQPPSDVDTDDEYSIPLPEEICPPNCAICQSLFRPKWTTTS